MNTISIEKLAELLGGKLWIKGDMKRIYLERGYNTKKMSTKTYVYQREDGTYGVSCYIDCPSQHDNWISKERDSIIESVEAAIETAIEKFEFEFNNPGVDYYEYHEEKTKREDAVAEAKEFEENIEKYKEGWKSDYERAVVYKSEFEKQEAVWNNLSEESKFKLAQLKKERGELTGVPGGKQRRNELDGEIKTYPSQPFALHLSGWMADALRFNNVEQFIQYKFEIASQKFAPVQKLEANGTQN